MKLDISFRQIWTLAYPIMLGGIAQNIINVTDTMFMARVGKIELAASALGSVIFYSFTIVGVGLASGTQILVARRTGESRDSEVGGIVDQALYVNFACALLMCLAMTVGLPYVMPHLSDDAAVRDATVSYLGIRAFEIFPALLFWVFRAFYTGIGHTRIIMYSVATMASLNALLNYCLVFGKWGFPEMGIEGSAIASLTSETIGVALMIGNVYLRGQKRQYNLFRLPAADTDLIGQHLNLSLPTVLQYLISMVAWAAFFVLIGQISSRDLAAASVVRSIYMVGMIPTWAFAGAGNAIVSNVIGQGKHRLVLPGLRRVIVFSTAISLVVAGVLIVMPQLVLELYGAEADVTAVAIEPLRIVGVVLIFCAPAVALMQGTTGTGATRFAFRMEVLLIAVYTLYIWVMVKGLHVHDQTYVWLVEGIYWIGMAIGFWWYLLRGNWRSLKV